MNSFSPQQIGSPPWSVDGLRRLIGEFSEIYKARPIPDNQGGMRAPHMFATFATLRAVKPQVVIESGVWKGAGTWLIEQAVPDAQIIAIDPNWANLAYRSDDVEYSSLDFNDHDWSGLPSNSLAFFDDHQDALRRLQQCLWHGLGTAIFEDNYPPGRGDCYSLKKAFSHAGFSPETPNSVTARLRALVRRTSLQPTVPPGDMHHSSLLRNIVTYAEFPPVVRPRETRWGDAWDDDAYPTPPALFKFSDPAVPEVFREESMHYTWLAFVRLSGSR